MHEKALSTFSVNQDGLGKVEMGKFNNAVEAFAQGRSFNSRTVSQPELRDVVGAHALFDCLKFDSKLRHDLLEAETCFESSKVLKPTHKLYWYWALHYYWSACMLRDRNKVCCCTVLVVPDARSLWLSKKSGHAYMFFVAACDMCAEALAHNRGYLKPLYLWGTVLVLLASTDEGRVVPPLQTPAGLKMRLLTDLVKAYLTEFHAFARARPTCVVLEHIERLSQCESGVVKGEVLPRALCKLAQKGQTTLLRVRACRLLLEMERDGRSRLPLLQHMYAAVAIAPNEALEHVESFTAMFHCADIAHYSKGGGRDGGAGDHEELTVDGEQPPAKVEHGKGGHGKPDKHNRDKRDSKPNKGVIPMAKPVVSAAFVLCCC
jgi:hypothetical protein